MVDKATAKATNWAGKWIRFMSGGRLVIGRVEYVEVRVGGKTNLITDVGSCPMESVLEMR